MAACRTFVTIASAITLCLSSTAVPAAGEQLGAREIIDRQLELHALPHEHEIVQLELVKKSGRSKERTLERFSLRDGDGLARMLAVMTGPEDVRGTGVLLVEQAGGDDEQWLFMPALDKVKKVAAEDRENKFMGTDFSYGDLRAEDPDGFTYAVVGEDSVDDRRCWIVEAVPASEEEAKATGYGRRRLWIAQEIFFPLKVEFYDTRDRLLKVLVNRELTQVGETAWRAGVMEMSTVKNGHRSIMRVLSRNLDEAADQSLFTVAGLVSFSK
jgi:hypothetical protein